MLVLWHMVQWSFARFRVQGSCSWDQSVKTGVCRHWHPLPAYPRPTILFIFFKQLDQIIIHQQVELLEGMVQSLSPFDSAGTRVSPKAIQVFPPAHWNHCEPSCCPVSGCYAVIGWGRLTLLFACSAANHWGMSSLHKCPKFSPSDTSLSGLLKLNPLSMETFI